MQFIEMVMLLFVLAPLGVLGLCVLLTWIAPFTPRIPTGSPEETAAKVAGEPIN